MDRSSENKIDLEEILRGTAMQLQNISFIAMKKNAKCAVRALRRVQKRFMS
jgi:hypothetical protein